MAPTNEQLKRALSLAVSMLSIYEPPDSRAVSDEFVALACVDCGNMNDEVMPIIEAALARFNSHRCVVRGND